MKNLKNITIFLNTECSQLIETCKYWLWQTCM